MPQLQQAHIDGRRSALGARLTLSLLFALAAPLAACAATSAGAPCSAGTDCESGICNADGTCADAGATSSATGTASTTGAGGDGSGGAGGTGTGSGGAPFCSPDGDGSITRLEVPLEAGLKATFRVASNASFDTAGVPQADGSRTWSLAGALAGDHDVLIETMPLEGQWFAPSFPGATYASRLSEGADLLGVFEVTGAALLLRGVVSPTGGALRTELAYDPPVTVLSFPIAAGGTWSTNATVTGLTNGVFGVYSEIYASTVDAHGQLQTPFGDFAVQRIGVDLTRTVGALVTTTRTYLFATECFGTVATVTSNTNELSDEFTTASEIRRLAP